MRRLATFTEQGEISDAAIFVRGNVIEWVGRDAELPAALGTADAVLELRDHVMIPGMPRRRHAVLSDDRGSLLVRIGCLRV